MYLHGLLEEDGHTCHLPARKLGQLLCVALFKDLLNTQNAKVTLLIFSQLGDMCGRLLLVGHGTRPLAIQIRPQSPVDWFKTSVGVRLRQPTKLNHRMGVQQACTTYGPLAE